MLKILFSSLVFFPFLGSFFIFYPNNKAAKNIIFFFSVFIFFVNLFFWVLFDNSCIGFQFLFNFSWFSSTNFSLTFGLDGISLFFTLLTSFLIPLCLLSAWDLKSYLETRFFFGLFLIIESFILIVFSTLNLFVFYIFFEAVLIPIFFVIGIWGSRERKIRAAYLFFLYTLVGSLFMLFGIIVLFLEVGSLDYLCLLQNNLSFTKQKFLWLAFFLSFSSKVPIIPMHIWLPEAHVEAPTPGSVLLAGVLLKLGTYGFVRFSLPLFPAASFFFRPFVLMISCIAVVYTSLTAFRQIDIKRVIAYASVAHMNMTLVGLFSFTQTGIEGSLYQIFSHGVVSGALFLCIGVLYDRHHTRLIRYYGGLVQTIPIFSFFFLSFTIGNIALPGTSSFVGEFLILAGIIEVNIIATFISATGIILGGIYSLWLLNRVIYGNIKVNYLSFSKDVEKREFFSLIPLFVIIIFMGFFPEIFLQSIRSSVTMLLHYIIL